MPDSIEFFDVQDIRVSISDAADFREAADLVQASAMKLAGVDAVGIYALDSNGNLNLVSHAGVSNPFVMLFGHFPATSQQARQVLLGKPIYRALRELPPDRAALYRAEGLQAIAIYPIKHRKKVVGSLHIGSRQLPEIPLELCAQLEVFVQGLANTIVRITYEAMLHKAYAEVEEKIRGRTHELQGTIDALRESEARFHQLADSMPQIVWTSRPDGSMEYLNAKWFEYAGTAREETGFENFLSRAHPDDQAHVRESWQEGLRLSAAHWQCEFRLRHRSGGFRWNLARALAVCDEAGKVLRWFGTCTDINDQKLTEEALRDAHRRKDEFLAMLGHELRNPLVPIRNAAQILKHLSSPDPSVQRSLQMIDRQVTHMARLIDDLLDVSRITRGKITLKNEVLNLTEWLSVFAGDYRSICDSGGLEFKVELPSKPLWFLGDAARLQQIVGNLLNNAVKYTDHGGKVCLALQEDDGHALVSVRDTGIGMEPSMLGRIFEIFQQADRSIDRSHGGLGLGLALARGLAEMHGGSVRAESPGLGKGSTFTVRLPLQKPVAMPQPPPKAEGEVHMHRILVVEDNADAAESMQVLLTMLGYEVLIARAGREGLERAHSFLPEVMLCDIGLPDINGYEVARALRADSTFSQICLIAMSGYGQEEDRRRALDAGFNRHLTKPVDPEFLRKILSEAIVNHAC